MPRRTPLPRINPQGLLRFAERFVAVSPSEAPLLERLIRQFGVVVPRSALHECLPNPRGEASREELDLRIMRLRRRIRPLDLVIRIVRGHGYLLEAAGDRQPAEPKRARPVPQPHQRRHLTGCQGRSPSGQLNGLNNPEHTAKVTPLRRQRSGHGVAIRIVQY